MASNDTASKVGITSFAVQLPSLLPGLFQTFGLYLGAMEVGKASSELQWQLRRAEQKLAAWVVVSGWSSGNIEYSIRHKERFILWTIRDIFSTNESIGEIMTKYDIKMPPPGQMSGIEVHPPFTLKTIEELVEDKKAAEKKIIEYRSAFNPRKYEFAARDQEELAKLVTSLHVQVDSLLIDLSPELQTELSSLYRNDDIDKIERLNKMSISELCLERDKAVTMLQAQQVNRVVTLRGEGGLCIQPDDASTSIGRFVPGLNETQFNRTTGIAKWNEQKPGTQEIKVVERNALVELRLIPKGTPTLQTEAMQRDFTRLCKKFSLDETQQHREMRVLQALGLKVQTTRIGGAENDYFCLIYSWPRGFQPVIHNTLYDVLKDASFRPPLEDRLRLALQLVKTVFRLSHHKLFHKAIRSTNVVFFEQETATGGTTQPALKSIKFPYLCGFEYSRSVDKIDLSLKNGLEEGDIRDFNDLYRHLDCRGGVTAPSGNFRVRYDMYSLGIMLCEIGQWAPVNKGKFWKVNKQVAKVTIDRRDSLLLMPSTNPEGYKSPLNDLSHKMGSDYYLAARNCLDESCKDNLKLIEQNIVTPMEKACTFLANRRGTPVIESH